MLTFLRQSCGWGGQNVDAIRIVARRGQQTAPSQLWADVLGLGCWDDIGPSLWLAFLPWRSHRLEKKRQRRLQRLPWGQCQLRYWSRKGWCPIQGQRVLLSSFHAGVLPSVAVMTTSSRPATVRLDSPIPDTDHLSGTVGTKLMRNDLLSVMCCVALGWVGVPPCWFLGFLVHRRFIAVSLPFSSVVLLISVTVSSLSIFISSISSPVLISSVSSLISSYSFLLLPLPLRIIFQELQATFCFMAELCRRRGWGWCNIFHF